jgi:hypothetical protein
VVNAVAGLEGNIVGLGALCNRGGVTPKILAFQSWKLWWTSKLDSGFPMDCRFAETRAHQHECRKGREYLARKSAS